MYGLCLLLICLGCILGVVASMSVFYRMMERYNNDLENPSYFFFKPS